MTDDELRSEMFPPTASDDGAYTSGRHAELLSEHSVSDFASNVRGANVIHLSVCQFSDVLSRFSACALLKSCVVCVQHLFAHRGRFQIAGAIVMLLTVLVVDRQSRLQRADEMLVNQSMQQKPLTIALSVAKPNSHVAFTLAAHLAHGPAPVAFEMAHLAVVADFVQTFVVANGLPDGWHV